MTASIDRSARPARAWLALLGFLAAVAVVAVLGSLATVPNVDGWYADADKPWFTPPDGVFGPTWTVLYAAMAVAAWLVWRTPASRERSTALTLWWAQLALNLAWTPVFFAAQLLWPAAVVIVLLDVLVAATLVASRWVSRPAALLLVPYLAWVVFATGLNVGVARLN